VLLKDSEIKSAVAAALRKDAGDLPGHWDAVIANAHASGWKDVRDALAHRGLTEGQVAAWDRAAEYERRQSVYWALLDGGSPEAAAAFDQRPTLSGAFIPLGAYRDAARKGV
jgi:hypothetical protein